MRPIFILALCLLANTCFGQTIKVDAFDALLAKSVKVEQLTDSVAVILTDSMGSRTGAYLQVESDKKWATPVYDGIDITQTKTPGQWLMFAPAGKYRVLLAEFDPETGPRYTYHDVLIGKGDPPVDPDDPPSGDYASLTKVSKDAADKLNDPATRAALVSAYRMALTTIVGKPYDDARITIMGARRAVMQARPEASLMVEWNNWLKAVDAELVKVAPPGDAAKYAKAIEAIIKGLAP
jgi:hypothetical protein